MIKKMIKKQSSACAVIGNAPFEDGVFRLSVEWKGGSPQAGQFFLIKPARSSVLLGRPISVFEYDAERVDFLILAIGTGTRELSALRAGDFVSMIGPLGRGWSEAAADWESRNGKAATSNGKPIALVSGGLGCAPLICFAKELTRLGMRQGNVSTVPENAAHSEPAVAFYAGFPSASPRLVELIRSAAPDCVISTDDGSDGARGFVTDVFKPEDHSAVFSCGTAAMLKAVAEKCAAANTLCFISTENRMACGVGACLGCTIRTKSGNKRCCADGPVFNAEEVVFG